MTRQTVKNAQIKKYKFITSAQPLNEDDEVTVCVIEIEI